MSMNESGVVDKVAARIQMDITPAQQALLTLGADYQKFNQMLVQSDKAGMGQVEVSQEERLARIQQMEKDSNAVRLMAMGAFYQDRENQQKLFDQKYLNNEQMNMERLMQLQEQGQAKLKSLMNRNLTASNSSTGTNGFHISAGEMAKDMLMWGAFNTIFQNVQEGLVQVGKDAAGLQQVFHGNIQTQDQLNQVTNQFIDIAKQYGASVDEVMQAGKLWGRQYSEQISEVLTANSTLLSIVDNLSVTDANKAVESSMQALGIQVTNVNDAMTNSMKIIDSWTAVSHSTSVSTKDLADGFERAAASAKQVGLNVDQLSALVAAGVRNSGRTGTVVGNMWKSVLDNIASGSTKVQDAFQQLGIQMYTVGANGEKQLRPIWQIINDLSTAAEHSTVAQTKYFSTIAGGKYQFDTLRAAVTDLNTIQNAYTASLNSQGETAQKAQAQMHTLAAELQRLKDSIQQMAFNAGSSGLGDMLKGLVVGLTDFINGLQKLPAAVDWTLVGFAGLLLSGKALVSTFNTFSSVAKIVTSGIEGWGKVIGAVAGSAAQLAGATTSLTADLEAKTIATSASVVADEEATVAIGAMTTATEAETVAAGEAATAAGMLDAALAPLTLGLSIILPILAGVTIAIGAHASATRDDAQAQQQLNDQIKQSQQDAQNQVAQTQTQINQLQQLKQQYADVSNTLANSTEGSQQYKQAQADLADIQQQLIGVVGEEKAAELTASKDKVKAWNDEVQAKIQSQIDSLQSDNTRLKNEQDFTSAFVTESNKRIAAIINEAQAQATAGQLSQYHGQFAYDIQSAQPANPEYDENAIQHQMFLQSRHYQAQDMSSAYGGPLADKIKQLEDMKKALQLDPNKIFGNISSSSGGGSVGGSGSGGGKSSNTYVDQFSKLSQFDDYYLEYYKQKVDNASVALDNMNQTFTKANDNLKAHVTDTKAAADALKAYNDDVKALNDHANALAGENWQLNQELSGVSAKMKQVDADFKAGRIDAQTHQEAISELNNEYGRLTSTLNSNTQAIQKDKDAIVQATTDIKNEMVNALQQAYQDEEQIQQQALDNIYQPQIDALQQQKDAIDANIQSLQAMWQQQDENNKLAELQGELASVEADKRFEIVGLDGKLSYTYDTAKASDLQKQIADEQTKMQRDRQLQELQKEKDTLDKRLKLLQKFYSDAKKELDDYWKYKLQQDQLKQDVDNLVLENGLNGALGTVQDYASKIIGQYNAIQQAATMAATAIGLAQSLGSSGVGNLKLNPQAKDILSQLQSQGLFDSAPHMAGGGMVPLSMGIPGVDSVPTMLAPGEIVVPSWDDLTKFVSNSTTNSAAIHIDRLEFPNVRNAGDAQGFVQELMESVKYVR